MRAPHARPAALGATTGPGSLVARAVGLRSGKAEGLFAITHKSGYTQAERGTRIGRCGTRAAGSGGVLPR